MYSPLSNGLVRVNSIITDAAQSLRHSVQHAMEAEAAAEAERQNLATAQAVQQKSDIVQAANVEQPAAGVAGDASAQRAPADQAIRDGESSAALVPGAQPTGSTATVAGPAPTKSAGR